jgi:hypothetical protein
MARIIGSQTTRTAHGAVRVLAAPWTYATTEDGEKLLLHEPFAAPGTVVSEQERIDGLTDAQLRMLAAAHEGGHALTFTRIGIPVLEVSLYTEREHSPAPGFQTGHGHVRVGGERRAPVADLVIAHLAGQAASEVWLERTGLLTPLRRLRAQIASHHDHAAILEMATDVPVAYLYGEAEPPAGWQGDLVRIDDLLERARAQVTEHWTALDAFASHLDSYGHADATATRAAFAPAAPTPGRSSIPGT